MDVYSNPDNFGLTIVGELSAGDSYDYNKLVVWKNARNDFYAAQDSGCSCSSPFEDYSRLDSLTLITSYEIKALENMMEHLSSDVDMIERALFKDSILKAMRESKNGKSP